MKIFSAKSVRSIDNYTIENEPVASIDLMERAAMALTDWYVKKYRTHKKVIILAGPGNNGGDALAVARLLSLRNYKVNCFILSFGKQLSEDCAINLKRLQENRTVDIVELHSSDQLPDFSEDGVIIDGIFGSGLTREVRGAMMEIITRVNQSGCEVVSIDIPSGLFGEDNANNHKDAIVQADFTLTFQFPFLSFFFEENYHFTGQWEVLDIGLHQEAIASTFSEYVLLDRRSVRNLIPKREKFSHKGTYGHALVIAGKYGMMGAALLAGKSALRAGAGLVSIHVPTSGCEIVQTTIPEALMSMDRSEILFSEAPDLSPYQAVAIGPGLGTKPNSAKGLRGLLENCSLPIILDADALNIISSDESLLQLLPANAILTPHPKEFDRLAGSCKSSFDRHMKQRDFSSKYGVIVVLKGAYTGISFPDGSYVFNTNGNPGMATGGSGDVLSGIIVSLLARGLKPGDAAKTAVFLHGMAGDLAAEKIGQEALIAGDIIAHLGEAFKRLNERMFLHEGRPGGVIQ